MPKHKQKVLKQKSSKRTGRKASGFSPALFQLRNRRLPILAGLAVALLVAPAGWLMVNAQSAGPLGGFVADSRTAKPPAGNVSATATGDKATSSGTAEPPQAGTTKPGGASKSASDPKAVSKSTAGSAVAGNHGAISPSGNGGQATASTSPAKPATQPAAPASVASGGVHDNIITTIFWVGEAADASNANISNAESAWDGSWQTHYGGFDDPNHRSGYYPAAFVPKENPFYFALPYNDLDNNGSRKPSANNCANTGAAAVSWCKNTWIKVTKGAKTAYAQWQDVGPLQEDDATYVFGTARPKNTWGAKAGLDVSPAMRDYLSLQDVDTTNWSFVSAAAVPAGPWKNTVTTSPGGW